MGYQEVDIDVYNGDLRYREVRYEGDQTARWINRERAFRLLGSDELVKAELVALNKGQLVNFHSVVDLKEKMLVHVIQSVFTAFEVLSEKILDKKYRPKTLNDLTFKGQIEVDPGGDFTYTIPISVSANHRSVLNIQPRSREKTK